MVTIEAHSCGAGPGHQAPNLRDLYQVPILLYDSETWTILKADLDRLQAFHMRAQRQLLGVRWQDMIKNVIISEKTGLPLISVAINKRRLALFGHVARLTDDMPANRALWTAVQSAQWSLPLLPSWRRPRGKTP